MNEKDLEMAYSTQLIRKRKNNIDTLCSPEEAYTNSEIQ